MKPRILLPPASAQPTARSRGFTLLEVLIAMSLLLIAMTVTMAAYLSALKRGVHAEHLLEGTTQLRRATELISEAVRSSPISPSVDSTGRQLTVPPRDLGFATVLETTWIDALHNVKGSKSNQRMLHLSNVTPSIVAVSAFLSTSRPADTLSASDVTTYFKSAADLPTTDLNDLFASGDTLTIPATAYGPATTGVINNISNNSGNKTLTLTAALGVDVPNGTRITATGGRRLLFTVESGGELRYYPDSRDRSRYVVLARDIDPAPLSDPADTSSSRTAPFALTGRYLTLNLQLLPGGTTAGRTLQGVRTSVYVRSDSVAP